MMGVSGLSDTHTHIEVTRIICVTASDRDPPVMAYIYFRLLKKLTFLWLTYHVGHFYGVLIRHTMPHQEEAISSKK